MTKTHPADADAAMSGKPGTGSLSSDAARSAAKLGTGLTSEQARALLVSVGPNEPASTTRKSGLGQILPLVANPLVVILLIACAVSAVLGELVSAGIIVAVVVVGSLINYVQTYRSEATIEKLRAQVAPTATVLRDGAWVELPRREVVPGDLLRLSAGDLVPADAHLESAKDLHVQEAALTGESLPVEKNELASAPSGAGAAAAHSVFLGTSVVSGSATARVYATGPATAFGDIATRIAKKPPETEFERGMRRFGLMIMWTVLTLTIFVVALNIGLHRGALESMLFAVALAVGLTPEFLPMITAVTLAKGARHMAREHVVVKHLAAMQNFGSIDVLCSDKTGTLTSGSMALAQHVDPKGTSSQQVLLLAYLNSTHQTGIKSPLDAAILAHEIDGAEVQRYTKLDEIPYDFERRRLSVVVQSPTERWLVTKGAPESVLAICTHYAVGNEVRALDDAARTTCLKTSEELAKNGFRTLGVASRDVEPAQAYGVADETGLLFMGFLAFLDPPLPDAAAAIRDLERDGVQIKILTGDSELVTQHVCAQVGLDSSSMVLGDELERMSDVALAHVAERTTIFARVSPAQKSRIILALKSRSHVVGFLGDGINDAPSLHVADVGISVATAVDIAKDAAEIILLQPGLRVLHSGIMEGRKAFGNVIKYLLMDTSSNFGNMFSMAGAPLLIPYLPMLPMQILLNNFLYDVAQIPIPTDRVDPSFMLKPRRWDISLIRNFMLVIGPISSLYDFLTFYVMNKLFHASEAMFHTGWFVESLATQTLVVFVIRTTGNPLRTRPSLALTASVLGVVAVGALLPFTRFAQSLGFTPLPAAYFAFLAAATATYLVLVQTAKFLLFRKL